VIGAELLSDLQTETRLAAVCFWQFSNTHLITGAELEALGQFYTWKGKQGFRTQFSTFWGFSHPRGTKRG